MRILQFGGPAVLCREDRFLFEKMLKKSDFTFFFISFL